RRSSVTAARCWMARGSARAPWWPPAPSSRRGPGSPTRCWRWERPARSRARWPARPPRTGWRSTRRPIRRSPSAIAWAWTRCDRPSVLAELDQPRIGLGHDAVDPPAVIFPDHVVQRLDAVPVRSADLDVDVHVAVRRHFRPGHQGEGRAGDLGIAALDHALEGLAIEHPPDLRRREDVGDVIVVPAEGLELLHDGLGRRLGDLPRLGEPHARDRERR